MYACMLCTQNQNMILCNFQAVLKIELLIKKYLNIHKKLSKSVSEMEFYSIQHSIEYSIVVCLHFCDVHL